MLINTFLISGFAATLLLLSSECSTYTNSKSLSTNDAMKVSVAINQNEQGLFCLLFFQNDSRFPFYLNKIDAGLKGGIKSKIFIIKKDGEPISYNGILMKRRIATVEDFVLLNPGDSLRTSIRIDTVYAFSKGMNSYTLQYSYYHSSPEEEPQLNKLESNIVKFEYFVQ